VIRRRDDSNLEYQSKLQMEQWLIPVPEILWEETAERDAIIIPFYPQLKLASLIRLNSPSASAKAVSKSLSLHPTSPLFSNFPILLFLPSPKIPKPDTALPALPHATFPSTAQKVPASPVQASAPSLLPIQTKFCLTHLFLSIGVPSPLGIALIQKCAPSTALSDANFQPT
jgi:hypothetical protein